LEIKELKMMKYFILSKKDVLYKNYICGLLFSSISAFFYIKIMFLLKLVTLFLLFLICFFSFAEKKVLDLGDLEITGEVRRPNIDVVYPKKYFDKAINIITTKKLKEWEQELLKPFELPKKK